MTMQKYVSVKLVEAEPMDLGSYNTLRGWQIPADKDPRAPGFLVVYPDGYHSWCPKDAFERSSLPLCDEDGSRVMQEDVDGFVGEATCRKLDAKTTLVSVETLSGFVQHEASSCVDPANYDEGIGKEMALGRIKDRIWPCLGFVLQWARFGLRSNVG